MNETLQKVSKIALIGGLLFTAISIVGAFLDTQAFFRAYLVAFVFCIGIPLGAMAVGMVHCLTHGAWGFLIRREYLSLARTLPFLALLFIPIVFGIKFIYSWADPAVVEHDHIIQLKAGYLNVPFFVVRAVVFFLVWIIVAFIVERRSNKLILDKSDDGRMNLQLAAGLCLLAYVFASTFAGFDWLMSLMPQWFSTIYGIHWIIGNALAALCFMIIFVVLARGKQGLADNHANDQLHDVGNLSLALIMLWMYMAFSQFIIIWSGNLPEEIIWYLPRYQGGWQHFATFLAAVHFFVPFFLLLNRSYKRSPETLARIAGLVLFMRFMDVIWNVSPTYYGTVFGQSWMMITLPLGMFGLWFAFYLNRYRSMAS